MKLEDVKRQIDAYFDKFSAKSIIEKMEDEYGIILVEMVEFIEESTMEGSAKYEIRYKWRENHNANNKTDSNLGLAA